MHSPFEAQLLITQDGISAIDALAAMPETLGLSKQHLKTVMQKGAVWLALNAEDSKPQRLRRAKKSLQAGNILYLYYDEKVLNESVSDPQLFADLGDYSVWIKPKGMRSQGSKWSDHNTLNRWIQLNVPGKTNQPCLMIHRLDKATDGLMLVAHSHQTAVALRKLFEARKIVKIYQAWVAGEFPENPQDYDSPVNGKPAISHAKRLAFDVERKRSLVEVNIETGRKHQIRIHLSQAGYPIIGDRLYHPTESHTEDLQLSAVFIKLLGDSEHFQQTFALLNDKSSLKPS
ncbi:pseudouridine synthase family protein [Thiosulfativibrio zosterae]|uniref:Putative RNA pseudouridine synthase n=1 Tax=Thiosulfativibrio zosterae TaxID=2675053 RepID=A0A6F8PKW9_9GAMM|nr:RNA pseudouridine synthase [Thiosulfativibrio zosterae]BBP42753.1 putative RNA pseudouridine synthase [Thiosulfativibrio zosterae]